EFIDQAKKAQELQKKMEREGIFGVMNDPKLRKQMEDLQKRFDARTIFGSSQTDPNKILPMKYLWARKYYKDGIANNWVPEEISMQSDVGQWKSATFLTNNLVLAVYRHVTNPECRQYLLRQAFEEAVHTDTFIYCCDSLGLDPEEIYNMYLTIPSIEEKDNFVIELTKSIFDPKFEIKDDGDIQLFLHDLIGYYVIMEGIFFYAGFAMMLALKRSNKMVGIGQQFEFIMRDESLHLGFGCDLINTIKSENPQVWTPEFQKEIIELIKQAVELEKKYALDACPEGVTGINAEHFSKYVEYVADQQLSITYLQNYFASQEKQYKEELLAEMQQVIENSPLVIQLREENNTLKSFIEGYKLGKEFVKPVQKGQEFEDFVQEKLQEIFSGNDTIENITHTRTSSGTRSDILQTIHEGNELEKIAGKIIYEAKNTEK
ncbi:32568_t:CDS:2, partial [Gigaspora margarita]